MAQYKVVAPCAVIKGGRAWQVGDVIEVDDAKTAGLESVLEPVVEHKEHVHVPTEPVRKARKSEPEGDGDGE